MYTFKTLAADIPLRSHQPSSLSQTPFGKMFKAKNGRRTQQSKRFRGNKAAQATPLVQQHGAAMIETAAPVIYHQRNSRDGIMHTTEDMTVDCLYSSRRGIKQGVYGRELQPYFPSPPDDSEALPCCWWDASQEVDGQWDQFEVNERLTGHTTTFDMAQYTTVLDLTKMWDGMTPDKAAVIAREIEGGAHNAFPAGRAAAHLAEERGQEVEDAVSEEERYSSVQRDDMTSQAQGVWGAGELSECTQDACGAGQAEWAYGSRRCPSYSYGGCSWGTSPASSEGGATQDTKAGPQPNQFSTNYDGQKILQLLRTSPSASSRGGDVTPPSTPPTGNPTGLMLLQLLTPSLSAASSAGGATPALSSAGGVAPADSTPVGVVMGRQILALLSGGGATQTDTCTAAPPAPLQSTLNPHAKPFTFNVYAKPFVPSGAVAGATMHAKST